MVFPLHLGYINVNRNQEGKKNEISLMEGYCKCVGKLCCDLNGGEVQESAVCWEEVECDVGERQ